MAKTKTTEALAPALEEEESYLIYNIYITTLNITVESGATLIMQTGKPTPPPGPPDE